MSNDDNFVKHNLRALRERKERVIAELAKLVRARRRHLCRGPNDKLRVRGQVCAVLTNTLTGKTTTHETTNIVTTDGDLYYAERAALLTTGTPIAPVPTDFTDTNGVPDMEMELYEIDSGAPTSASDRSTGGTLITNSLQAMDATFPENDNQDAANTGKGTTVVTYKVSYTTANANGSIDDVILTNPSPGASENCISYLRRRVDDATPW
jgi:hypothetical protein